MQPNIIVHYPAILMCLVAGSVFGYLWYGPLFGKIWIRILNEAGIYCKTRAISETGQPPSIAKSLVLQWVGIFLMAHVLSYSVQVWRPSTWGLTNAQDLSTLMYGFYAGFFTWIGFFIPVQLRRVAWEGAPWTLFFINAGHDLIVLQIVTQILSNWK